MCQMNSVQRSCSRLFCPSWDSELSTPRYVLLKAGRAARLVVAEEENQNHPGDETADVRHIRDPAAFASQRAETADELQQTPQPDHDDRGQLGNPAEDAHRHD